MLPDDERLLVDHLTDARGLRLLRSDDLRDGPPLFRGQLDPPPLPPPPEPLREPQEPSEFLFWWPEGGELRRLGDAPAPEDPVGHVALKLTQSGTEHWRDVLDSERSPIIRWSRCHWHASGALCPGLLQAQSTSSTRQPPELLGLHRRAKTWMQKQGVRINPFDHAPDDVPVGEPANLNAFWVWAFPAAEAWVRDGGTVWPWNA